MNGIMESIRERRSIRFYLNKPVSYELINKVVEAGTWAPSVHNLQPWFFIVISGDKKADIAQLLLAKKDSFSIAIKPVITDVARIINEAPVLILGYNRKILFKKFKSLGPVYAEKAIIFEIQSISCSFQNMQLIACTLGLGTTWLGIANFLGEEISKIIKENKNEFFGMLALGYPKEIPNEKRREVVSKVVRVIN